MTQSGQPLVKPARVFLVEDETIIAMLMEDMLDELGYVVAVHASSLDDGIAFAREGTYDLAILDINITGGHSFPIASVVAQRGIPFLFCSGYGRPGIPIEWTNQRCLTKPFSLELLENAMFELLSADCQVDGGTS